MSELRCRVARTLAVVLLLAPALPSRAQGQDAGPSGSACARFTRFCDRDVETGHHLDRRVPPPEGFERKPVADPFGAWLRHLPLREGRPRVRHHDGSAKGRQDVHHAVVDLDVGRRDLQQCADTILRLRAEWLWSRGAAEALEFRFVSGHLSRWSDWAAGMRPQVHGSKVTFAKVAEPDAGRESFRRWLDSVFTYAGTPSLERDLKPVARTARIEPGDVFVRGGSPGHAVMVVDVVERPADGARMFLLVQGFMPAQEAHVLRRPGGDDPWYPEEFGDVLETPEWTFAAGDRRRF